MANITVRYCFDVEIGARQDPRAIGGEIYDRISTMPLARVTDARYTVTDGQPISQTGTVVPVVGFIKINGDK